MLDLAAIEASGFYRAISLTPGLYPAVSAAHLFGIALLFGPMALVDLRLARLLGEGLDAALPTLLRCALVGFALAVLSGLLLVGVQAVKYAQNPALWLKALAIAVAGANALAFHLAGRVGPSGLARLVGSPLARRAGLVSLAAWTSAILAGRWIAFV